MPTGIIGPIHLVEEIIAIAKICRDEMQNISKSDGNMVEISILKMQ